MIKEYAIVIRLNQEFAAKAQELNSTFAYHLSGLENPSNIWHITLYHGAYKAEDLPKIWDEVKRLDISDINLKFSQIYTTADRWIDWLVEKTAELTGLQREVVDIASPYHTRPLERCTDVFDQMTDAQKAQVDEYGVSGLFELYKPHATLFYQYPPDAALRDAAERAPESIDMLCQVESLILGELGYNGNITEILGEWGGSWEESA